MTAIANAKDQAAMNAARNYEAAQQAGIQQQANQITQGNITQATPQTAAKETAAGAANRNATFDALRTGTAQAGAALPPTGAGGARAGASGTAWGSLVGNNAAKAGGYADWEQEQAIKDAQAGQKLGILNSFAGGDARLLPTRLAVASQSANTLSAWGNIVSMIGNSVGGSAALNQYNNPQTNGGNVTTDNASPSAQAWYRQGTATPAANTSTDWSNLWG